MITQYSAARFSPRQGALQKAASLRIGTGGILPRSSRPWRRRGVYRITRRHRLQFPDDLVECRVRRLARQRRTAAAAQNRWLRCRREPRESRIPGTARLSRPRPHVPRGHPREVLRCRARWRPFRGAAAKTRARRITVPGTLRYRRRGNDVQRRRNSEPAHGLRPEVVAARSSGSVCRA